MSSAAPGPAPARSRVRGWLLAVLVGVPLVELVTAVLLARAVGFGWTLLLLLASSVAGALLVRREGVRTLGALRQAVAAGRAPGREVADAALVVGAGVLMLVPGLVTGVLGLLLALPLTRPLARRLLLATLARRVPVGPPHARRPGEGPGGPVVRGEVVDEP